MIIRLALEQANGETKAFDHQGPTIRLGRDPQSELAFEPGNTAVSWSHARIELTPGAALLRDLESTNGTYVNDQRLQSPRVLRSGDRIRLGAKGPAVRVLQVESAGAGDTVQDPTLSFPEPAHPAELGESGGTTRRMLVQATQRHTRNLVAVAAVAGLLIVGLGAVVLVLAGVIGYQHQRLGERDVEAKEVQQHIVTLEARQQQALADAAKARREAEALWNSLPADGKHLYGRVLKSTVFVYDNRPNGGAGTGSLIDRHKRWILTAYHVTPQGAQPMVFFADQDKDGKPVYDLQHYIDTKDTHIRGKMVAQDSSRDLAIIEVESLPAGVEALPLARQSANPGERVHTVGNPAASSALWVYNSGSVRAVAKKKVILAPAMQQVDCWTLEVQNPLNPGDSGGPMVNERLELVGVNSSVSLKGTLVNSCVDIREVHAVIGGIK